MSLMMQLIQKTLQRIDSQKAASSPAGAVKNRLSGRTIDLKPKKQKGRKSVIVKPTGRYARRMRRRKSA